MKRTLYLFLMCLFFVCNANSQIYSYRYSHSVNEDGVKKIHPWGGHITYVTFIKDKTICYWSNAKGKISQYTNSHKYVGKENDMYVYQDTGSNLMLVPNKERLWMFTTDFIQIGY